MERIRDTAVLQLQPLFNLMYGMKEKMFLGEKYSAFVERFESGSARLTAESATT